MKTTSSIFLFRDAVAQRSAQVASPDAAKTAGLAHYGRQAVASALMLFLVPLSIGDVYAQQDVPPPPPDYNGQASAYQALPPEELDRLVAPIALYPDSLVAQVLAAATYPAQVASAEQFLQQSGGAPPEQIAQMADQQPWDPSVKALTAFPQVLSNLNQNMQWTTQLGNAYYNQPQDVMAAVQGMRQQAYSAGNLRPTQQLNVVYNPGAIVIEPVSPEVVYVPYYDPWAVYGSPIRPWGYYHYYGPPSGVALGVGLAIGFGVGVAIGAFGHFGWGYHNWAPNWGSRTVVYNHNTYISNSVTVVNHGNYGGFDRNPQARAFNHGEAARFANVNHTTINNVTVNRTNINNNNRNNFNGNNGRPGAPAQNPVQQGAFNPRTQQNFGRGQQQGGQPGQFNNNRPGQTAAQQPVQQGQFGNNARPGQTVQPGQFSGTRGGQAPQGGQFNNTRPGQPVQQGQFGTARPSQPGGQQGQFGNNRPAQQGQFGSSRPAQTVNQPGQFNGGARVQPQPQVNPGARPGSTPPSFNRGSGGGQTQHAAPQQHQAAQPHESHGGGGGEHHH